MHPEVPVSQPSTRPSVSSPSSGRGDHAGALLAAVAVTVLWSSSWVLIRIGLDDESLPPLTFAGLRYGTAAVVLWVWTIRSGGRRAVRSVTRRELAELTGLGLGFYALTQGAQFIAIDHQPAATTSLVLSLTPLVVAAVGGATIGERTGTRQVVGAVLVVVGAATYFGGDLGATTIGMVAAVVGLAANAGSGLFGRQVNRRADRPAVVVTTISMSVGAAVLLATGLVTEGVPTVSATGAAIIVWLAVVNTALAFTLWNASLRHLTAVESAGINNLMLIQIALLAWAFLGEFPGAIGFVGITVVSVGIFLTQTARGAGRRRRSRT
jgi:drug/metabolite transporter (DMT)-like permease